MGKDDLVEPLVVSPAQAQRMLGLGRTKFYEILPELESYKDGADRRITVRSIRARVERLVAADKGERAPKPGRKIATGTGSSDA